MLRDWGGANIKTEWGKWAKAVLIQEANLPTVADCCGIAALLEAEVERRVEAAFVRGTLASGGRCLHANVVRLTTPGTFWKCSDCGETFYLHPTDKSQHGFLAPGEGEP